MTPNLVRGPPYLGPRTEPAHLDDPVNRSSPYLIAILLFVAAACGDEQARPASEGGSSDGGRPDTTSPNTTIECVPGTTIPGQTTEPPDPATCKTIVVTLPASCDDAAIIQPPMPTGGWLDGEVVASYVEGEIEWIEEAPVDEAPGLEGVDVPAVDAILASGRVVTYCSPDGRGRVDARSDFWVMQLADGGVIEIESLQMVEPVDTFNLATNDPPIDLADGGQMIRSDLFPEGSLRTVWLVEPDGLMVKVRAKGENAPRVAGWPTTIPPLPDTGDPSEAPLGLDQLQQIAENLLANA